MKTAVQILDLLADIEDVKVDISHDKFYSSENWTVEFQLDISDVKVNVRARGSLFELTVIEAWEKFEKSISKGVGAEKLQPLQLSAPKPDDYRD